MSLKKSKATIKNRYRVLQIISVACIVLAVPLYFLIKPIFCSGCREIGCAFCDLEAVIMSALVFIFGVVGVIVGIIELRRLSKYNGSVLAGQKHMPNKSPALTTIRWFLVVIFGIMGIFSAYSLLIRLSNSVSGIDGSEIIVTIIFIGGALLLAFWNKIIYKK